MASVFNWVGLGCSGLVYAERVVSAVYSGVCFWNGGSLMVMPKREWPKHPRPSQNQFLEKLRLAVVADGRRKRELARLIGINESGMSRFMAGELGLGPRRVKLLLDALGLEVVLRKKR